MAKARKSLRAVKRNPLIISIHKKRAYALEDLEYLREQLVLLATVLARRQSPRFIASTLDESALKVTVHAQGNAREVLRTYCFRPERCERAISSSREINVMAWHEALEDLQSYLRKELRKKAKELAARAAAYNKLAGGMMVNAEVFSGLQVS